MPTPEPISPPVTLLSRLLDPGAPRPLKLAAARGALPLPRQDLVLALVRLSADPDPEVSSESLKNLSATPKDVLSSLFQDPRTDPAVLEHFGRRPETATDLLAAIVVNGSTPDEVLLHLASTATSEILDRLVTNESRLVRTPAIAAALKENPALHRDARRRITELEEHLLGRGGTEMIPSGTSDAAPFPVEELPVGSELPLAESPETEFAAEILEVPLTPEEQAAENALRNTPLFQRIVQMSVAERIQAALKGSAEERAILIRDPSRLVAASVLKSPKLSEQEIEGYSKLRNVSDDVLRIIGNHRDWTKAYAVAHALTRNPRTPTGTSLTMLNRLVNKDLKNLGTDKNIPEVIRRSAKRLFDLRTKPVQKGKKK